VRVAAYLILPSAVGEFAPQPGMSAVAMKLSGRGNWCAIGPPVRAVDVISRDCTVADRVSSSIIPACGQNRVRFAFEGVHEGRSTAYHRIKRTEAPPCKSLTPGNPRTITSTRWQSGSPQIAAGIERKLCHNAVRICTLLFALESLRSPPFSFAITTQDSRAHFLFAAGRGLPRE